MTKTLKLPVAAIVLATIVCGCGDSTVTANVPGASGSQYQLSTTRLCSLVPARDAALGSTFPQDPPIKVFGTDLGWTYELQRHDHHALRRQLAAHRHLPAAAQRRLAGDADPAADRLARLQRARIAARLAVSGADLRARREGNRVRTDRAHALGWRRGHLGAESDTPVTGFPRRTAGMGHLHRRRRTAVLQDRRDERRAVPDHLLGPGCGPRLRLCSGRCPLPRPDEHQAGSPVRKPTICTSPSASGRRRTCPAPCFSPTST